MHGGKCKDCQTFAPHMHLNRLQSPLKPSHFIWPCAHGDITFAPANFMNAVIDRMHQHPDREFYLQSKNPACFGQYLTRLPANTILLTTLETNRDQGYPAISRAPVPTKRARAFTDITWPRKIVTIEPLMAFDLRPFLSLLRDIAPEAVWLGYNTRRRQVKLPEPSQDETKELAWEILRAGITIKPKDLR